MKNLLRKGLLLICVLMLAAAMTACGSGKSDDKEDKPQTEDTTQKDDTEDEDADTADDTEDEDGDYYLPGLNENGKFNTLDDFINSSIMQDQLEDQVSSLEEAGISCDISADGEKLIYTYTITDDSVTSAADMSALKESLDSSLESQTDVFTSVAASLPDAVEGMKNPVVVVRYLDSTGAEITSREFPAE